MSALMSVIRAESFKSFRKRRTYILAALLWVVLPLLVLLLGRVLESNLGGSFVDEEGVIGRLVQELASPYGMVRSMLVAPAMLSPSFYIIAVALFAGLLIGEEKSQNMWKTVLTAQPNRAAVLAGKLIVAMVLLGMLLFGGFVMGTIFGALGTTFLDTDFAGNWGDLLRLYLLQWLFAGTAMLFAFLLIFLTRNVSLGMVMVFFLPALIEGIYAIVRATIGVRPLNRVNAFFQALELQVTFENLPRYFFTTNLYSPARRPLEEMATLITGESMEGAEGPFANLIRTDLSLGHSGLVMLGYGLVFLAILGWLFLRRDVD